MDALMVASSSLPRLGGSRRVWQRHISRPLSPSSGVMRELLSPLREKMDRLRFGPEEVLLDLKLSIVTSRFMAFAGAQRTTLFSTAPRRVSPSCQLFQETSRLSGRPMTVSSSLATGIPQITSSSLLEKMPSIEFGISLVDSSTTHPLMIM